MAEISKSGDNAVLLLAAAYKLGYGPAAVKSSSKAYIVSDDIAAEAGFLDAPEPAEQPAPKKRAARKSTKKSTSKE